MFQKYFEDSSKCDAEVMQRWWKKWSNGDLGNCAKSILGLGWGDNPGYAWDGHVAQKVDPKCHQKVMQRWFKSDEKVVKKWFKSGPKVMKKWLKSD